MYLLYRENCIYRYMYDEATNVGDVKASRYSALHQHQGDSHIYIICTVDFVSPYIQCYSSSLVL